MLDAFLKLVAGYLALTYLVLDGHFGNHNALHIARPEQPAPDFQAAIRCGAVLPLLRPLCRAGSSSHVWPQGGLRPVQYLKETTVEGHFQTRRYQVQLRHKEFAQPVHVVIIATTHLQTQARAHVILFSSDLELGNAPLVDSYKLRVNVHVVMGKQ